VIGESKYDKECTQVRESTKARAACVIVIEGEKGNGFAVQAPVDVTVQLPQLLRQVADQIERTAGWTPGQA